jgi:hypothetical protein
MLPITTRQIRNLGLMLALTGLLVGSSALASVPAAPVITTPPANQTVNVGQTATFTVVATGGTLTYQWKKGAGNAPGASTGASYTTPATVAGDNGAQYTVVVTDGTGSVTSTPAAILTVNVQPAITTQPLPKSIVVGQTATFTVVATGNSLTYQWKKGAGNAPGASTGASYTTPPVVIGDNGAVYTVVVTNPVGNITSADAILTVGAATAPAIAAPGQPVNQSIVVGQTATFTVTASGSTPLTYLWKKGAGTAPGTSNAASYTTPAAVIGDNGAVYSCVVTNAAGTVTSNNAVLTVGAATAPGFTVQPIPQTVFVGQTATFSVTASGSTPLTYLWKKGAATAPGTSNAASYTTPATVIGDNGAMYSCVLTNAAGTATSTVVALTVNPLPLPTITTPPASQSVVVGQTATFTVVATGMGTLSYQWRLGGVAITGATAASYTTPVTTIAYNGNVYSVVVTNTPAGGPTTSGNATLTVTPLTPPTITVQPGNRTVVVGFPATFSVTATSTAAITYQWYKNGVLIGGATATTYTTPATTLLDNGALYTVIATNTAGGTTSGPATLTVETSSTSIPDYYFDADVGTVGMPGSASLDGSVFTVCGAGAGIGGTADAFNFLHQPLSGDGSVTARVTPGTTNPLARVGVMIRETLTAGSNMVGMFVTGTDGTLFLSRAMTGAAATPVAGTPATIPVPYWVRLARTGDTFVGSISADGSNWTVVGTATVMMPTGAFIGYAVTSGDVGALDCATVDSFSGTGGWRPALRKPSSGGGGGGGGCGLLGLEGALLAFVIRRLARSRGGREATKKTIA